MNVNTCNSELNLEGRGSGVAGHSEEVTPSRGKNAGHSPRLPAQGGGGMVSAPLVHSSCPLGFPGASPAIPQASHLLLSPPPRGMLPGLWPGLYSSTHTCYKLKCLTRHNYPAPTARPALGQVLFMHHFLCSSQPAF